MNNKLGLENNQEIYEAYPVLFITGAQSHFLMWIAASESESSEDDFLLTDNRGFICKTSSLEDMQQICSSSKDIHVNWDYDYEVNLNLFLTLINNLSTDSESNERECKVIIDSWNFLEDLAFTLGIKKESYMEIKAKEVYEKFFTGLNLPSTTPEGKSYHPKWTTTEINFFRKEISSLMKLISQKQPDLLNITLT